VFAEVVSQTLRYLGVPGTALPPPPPAPGAKTKAKAKLEAGPPEPAEPMPPTEAPAVDDDTDDGAVRIPDFTDMGVAQAVDAAGQAGIPLQIVGSGRAVSQDPDAGSAPPGTAVTVRFSDGTTRRLPRSAPAAP
jgi:hypothetical protein